MPILDDLRRWAARQIAPAKDAATPPAATNAPAPKPPAPVANSSRRSGWPTPVSPSPEQKRKQQSADLLEQQLSTNGPAGWASDHAEEANQCSNWVYIAVDTRAKHVAKASLEVYVQDPNIANEEGHRQVRPDHPLVRLFRKPNPKYDLRGLLYRVEMQLALTGTALIWTPRNGLGLPARLWVLPTALARPQPPSAEYPEGSYLVSVISLTQWAFFGASFWNTPSGAPLSIDARDICRITYPHPITEADGLSPVQANGQAIDISRETDEALWAVLQQGPMPGQLVSIDPSMSLDDGVADDIKTAIEQNIGGSRNAGKVQVVQGATVTQLTFSPSDVIPGDLRSQNRDNVLAMGGVPSVAAGITEATAYSGLYAALQQFYTGQIEPDLDIIAGGLTLHVAGQFGADLCIALKSAKLNDPDLKLRTAQQKKDSQCYTVNEIRACYDDGPHPDPKVGKSIAGQPPSPPQPPGGMPGMPGDDGSDPTDTEADDMDEDGTGQANPARRAAATLPPPVWKGGRQ